MVYKEILFYTKSRWYFDDSGIVSRLGSTVTLTATTRQKIYWDHLLHRVSTTVLRQTDRPALENLHFQQLESTRAMVF